MKPAVTPLRWLRAWALGGSSVGLVAAGHVIGGGHPDPALTVLLVAATSLGALGWVRRERGLAAIAAAVGVVQVVGHLALGAGHAHPVTPQMMAGHAAAALALAAFLRWGEARIFAAARRRYLQWVTAVRVALAGAAANPVWAIAAPGAFRTFATTWIHDAGHGRGPPVAAFC